MRSFFLALLFVVPFSVAAQDDRQAEQAIRTHDVLRVRITPKGPFDGLSEAILLVGQNGSLDLDKVRKGYGRVKVSRKTAREAEGAIYDHLTSKEFDVRVSVAILDAKQIQEEYAMHRRYIRTLPQSVAKSEERIRELKRALANTKTEKDDERPINVTALSALEICVENVDLKYPRGITRLFVVSKDGAVDLDYARGSYGRFDIGGKTAKEAAALILTELQKTRPDAVVRVELLSKLNIQGEISFCERSIERRIQNTERAKQNLAELEQALPVN